MGRAEVSETISSSQNWNVTTTPVFCISNLDSRWAPFFCFVFVFTHCTGWKVHQQYTVVIAIAFDCHQMAVPCQSHVLQCNIWSGDVCRGNKNPLNPVQQKCKCKCNHAVNLIILTGLVPFFYTWMWCSCLHCNTLPCSVFVIAQKANTWASVRVSFCLALLLNKNAAGGIFQNGAFFGTSFPFNIAPW